MSTAERLEELRDLPLVTAADRERYAQWEQEAPAALAEVEPPSARIERAYLRAAMRRRGWVVLRGHYAAGDTPLTRDEWRDHWRSLPDYDGPPMKPPSGPVFEFFDVTGTPSQEFSAITNTSSVWLREQITDEQARGHAELLQHFSAMARRGECKYKHPEPIDADPEDAYVSPSSGGRGWCRGLAGVSE